MTIDAPTFERLCGPIDDFEDRYWEQRPCHRRGGDFTDLFDVGTADRLLGAGALQVPNYLRLSRIEPTISDWEKHCRWMDTELGQPTPIIDVESALREYRNGRTIIFHRLRDRVPELDAFCAAIEGEIGHGTSADAFVTPPRSQCWDPHYDTADIFVLQIDGTKEWNVWDRAVPVPLPTHCPDQHATTGDPQTIVMQPGDVLYVPRGCPHAASTADEPSVHVTISIDVTTWRDALRTMLGPLHRQEALRATMPVGYNNDPSLLVPGTGQTLDVLASLLESVDRPAAAESIACRFRSRRATRVGALAEALAEPSSAK